MIYRLGSPLRAFSEIEDREPYDFDLRITHLIGELRKVTRARIEERIEHYLGTGYGLTSAGFYGGATKNLSPSDHSRILGEIKRTDLDCDLIVTNLDDEEPIMLMVDGSGEVSLQENYVCIGSGYVLARSFLCQEKWDPNMSVLDCAARVLSAKYAAEKDPHVGRGTHIVVMRPGVAPCNLSEDAKDVVQAAVKRLSFPRLRAVKPEDFGDVIAD